MVNGQCSMVNGQCLKVSEVAFYGDAAVFVFVILIKVYPMAEDVHRSLGGMLQGVTILQATDNDRREDVSRSRELDGGCGLSPALPS